MLTSLAWRCFALAAILFSATASFKPALGIEASVSVFAPNFAVVDSPVTTVPSGGTTADTPVAKASEQLAALMAVDNGLIALPLNADFVANQAAVSRLYLVLCRWRAWIVSTYPELNHLDIFNLGLISYLQGRVPATFAKILYVPFTYTTGCYGRSGWSCSSGCSSCCPNTASPHPHYWAPLYYFWQYYYPIWGNTGVPFAYVYLGMLARLGLVYPNCFASNYWSYFLSCTVTDAPPVLALPNAVAIPVTPQ